MYLLKKIYEAFIKIFNSIFIGVLNRNLKIVSSSTELNHFTKLHLSRRNLPIDNIRVYSEIQRCV